MISYNSKFKILIFINLGLLMFGQKMPRPVEVVANYYKALGGKENLQRVTSLKMMTELKVDDKIFPGTEVWLAPNIFKKSQKLGDEEIVQLFDGRFGYVSQGDFRETFPKNVIEKLKQRSLIAAQEFDVKDFKNVVEIKMNTAVFYVLEKPEVKVFFDKKTNLLSKIETSEASQSFENYKMYGEIMFPTKILTKTKDKTTELIYLKIVVNAEVTYEDLR
ncbi:hypothetical protein [Soonwooa purpurea]